MTAYDRQISDEPSQRIQFVTHPFRDNLTPSALREGDKPGMRATLEPRLSATRAASAKAPSQALKHFSRKSFEHLLFPLHSSAYWEIDRQLQEFEQRHPGSIAGLCTIFELNFAHATTEGAHIPPSALSPSRPSFDVHVEIDTDKLRGAAKCDRVKVGLVPPPKELGEQRANSNHLVVGLKAGKIRDYFIVPLPLLLRAFEDRVSATGKFQVYQHTLLRTPTDVARVSPQTAPSFNQYFHGAANYVGITSRTWQERAAEHQNATRRGSMLLFHRALRSELFEVFVREHIVLRAGLSRGEALRIEEIEVEQRTLCDLHPSGLNMIPGGEAGLRFLATMTKRPVRSIDVDATDSLLESTVNRSLRQPGLKAKGSHSNKRLAQLWQENIRFRISAMTHQSCRLSYQQIRNARIWHAAGWQPAKIHALLDGMGGREASLDQVQRLLEGKSYQTIPHVLLPDID